MRARAPTLPELRVEDAAFGPPASWLARHSLPVGAGLLHGDGRGAEGRYSVLCLEARETLSLRAGDADPAQLFPALEAFAASEHYAAPGGLSGPAPLTLCAIAYEAGRATRFPPEAHSLPLLWVARYAACYRWDHQLEEGLIISVDAPAAASLRARLSAPGSPRPLPSLPAQLPPAPPPVTRQARYREAFEEIQRALLDGEVYQINYTLRSEAPSPPGLAPSDLYRLLSKRSPAPFGALLRLDRERSIMSFSPERLLRWSATGHVETAPIKGTRRRGEDQREDQQLGDELQRSEKDLAEHLMIVDLERNDLGRVARPGSVTVRTLTALHRFPHVQHLISVVEAKLRREVGLAELLSAIFPGGSITGAPKRRAIELIERLETAPREIYCGALGYLDARGGGDLNLPIRTGWLVGDRFSYQAGGGIVADSEWDAEWEEALLKGAALGALLAALAPAASLSPVEPPPER